MKLAPTRPSSLLLAACLTLGAAVGAGTVDAFDRGAGSVFLRTSPVAQVTAKGPKGDKGDRGPAGPAGPRGATGATGARGPAGPAGAKGDAGPQGAKGDAGAAGSPGFAGATGPQGIQGLQGPAGVNGTNGTNGTNGADGADGADGVDGVLASSYGFFSNSGSQTISADNQKLTFSNVGSVASGTRTADVTYSGGDVTLSTAGIYEVQFKITWSGTGTMGLYVNGSLDTLLGFDHSTGLDTDSNVTNCASCVVDGSAFNDVFPTSGQSVVQVTGTTTLSLRLVSHASNGLANLTSTGGGGSDTNVSIVVKRIA